MMKKEDLPEYMQFFLKEVFPIWKTKRDGSLVQYMRKRFPNNSSDLEEKNDTTWHSNLSPQSLSVAMNLVDFLKDTDPMLALPVLESLCDFLRENLHDKKDVSL